MSEDKTKKSGAEQRAARRKVLKSTLIGGTVVSTSVMSERWTKPLIDAVITPAHAQMSVAVVLAGSVNVSITKQDSDSFDILDIFIEKAYAVPALGSLVGGCLTLTVNGAVSTAELILNNGASDTKTGTVSGTNVVVQGLHGGYDVDGTLNSATSPTACKGTIMGFSENGAFSVSNTGVGTCVPVAPTTTAAPTSTAGPTSTTTMKPNANSNMTFNFTFSDWDELIS